MTALELADYLGICRATLYHKLGNKVQWTLGEIIKLNDLAKQTGANSIDICVGGDFYEIKIDRLQA